MKEKAIQTKHVLWFTAALLLVLALVGLVGCGNNDTASSNSSSDSDFADLPDTTLILTDSTSKGAAGNLWAEAFAKNVSELTDGKLTVDYHGNGELGGDADIIRQEQANDVQMVISQPAPVVSFVPELAVFDLPMAFATYDADQIDSVLNGDNAFTQGLEEAFNNAGLHSLGWLQNGTFRETTSNKDLTTLEDFAGFQVRTMENTNHMDFWTALGAEPTPLAFAEVYFALQNGTVDGQENANDTSVGASFQEVQEYLAYTNHILYANLLTINKEAWDSLAPAYQDAIVEAAAMATEEIRPQLSELDEQNKQIMLDAGMTLIEYDDTFFETVLSNSGVKDLYNRIDDQTNGLSTILIEELENTKS